MAMQLASMVHGSVREQDAFQHSPYYHPAQPRYAPSNAPPPHFSHPRRAEHHYTRQRPQSPPSPPAEEQKPSLPSISSLLEFAGGEKPAVEPTAHSPQSQQRHSASPQIRQAPPGSMQQPPQPQTSRPDHFSSAASASHRMTLPPTPPMHPDVAHDGNHSPSVASSHSVGSVPYFGGSLNNMEPHQQRQSVSSMAPLKRDSLPAHSMSPYSASVYGQSTYASSPGGASSASFYSPEQHSYSSAGMYAQRPLPSSYQPQTMPLPVPIPSPAANSSNPWQHHHYISTSSQAQFPQSQDRYICSTCNKAFSRPSSLRIHSHSHTGEKPYKCPQPGCGKAFSVRSNMKRHERGCHAANSTPLTT
ncbi:hypothetical protein ACN47E_007724 [Coniothyrium glycines]